MECPKCQFQNPEGSLFCGGCGSSLDLDMICPHCGSKSPPGFNFCNKCGNDLRTPKETPNTVDSETRPPSPQSSDDETFPTASAFEGERKHVTILFSDLSGYTAMTEKLDPEDVKEIMSRIFGEITQIISKYEGFIAKFIGDAVMAVFGVPCGAVSDDGVRGDVIQGDSPW
jgi:GTP cyclohydrolase III